MSFKLEWNDNVVKLIEEAMTKGLEDATEELRAETYDLSRVDTSQTRESYKTDVRKLEEGIIEGQIGSNHKTRPYKGKTWNNAILEEFGTGIYAENRDGRKGGWVYPADGDPKSSGPWYFTEGKEPNKPMRRALANKRGNIEIAITDAFKEAFK